MCYYRECMTCESRTLNLCEDRAEDAPTPPLEHYYIDQPPLWPSYITQCAELRYGEEYISSLCPAPGYDPVELPHMGTFNVWCDSIARNDDGDEIDLYKLGISGGADTRRRLYYRRKYGWGKYAKPNTTQRGEVAGYSSGIYVDDAYESETSSETEDNVANEDVETLRLHAPTDQIPDIINAIMRRGPADERRSLVYDQATGRMRFIVRGNQSNAHQVPQPSLRGESLAVPETRDQPPGQQVTQTPLPPVSLALPETGDFRREDGWQISYVTNGSIARPINITERACLISTTDGRPVLWVHRGATIDTAV